MVFALAEVLSLEQLGQTDHVGSALGSLGDAAEGFLEILFWLRAAGHLDQGHAEFFWRHRSNLRDQYSIRGERVGSCITLISVLRGENVQLTAEIAEKTR